MESFFCRVAREARIDAAQLKHITVLASSPSLTVFDTILLMIQALVYLITNMRITIYVLALCLPLFDSSILKHSSTTYLSLF